MKKILLIISLLFGLSGVYAEDLTTPNIITGAYTWGISSSGKYIRGMYYNQNSITNLETMETVSYPDFRFGVGNSISDTGIAIGSMQGQGVLIKNGEIIVPETLAGANRCTFSAISAKGNRLCGSISYPSKGISGFFCCDIDENGVVGEPKSIPRPSLDLFGCPPQFVNILNISGNGKRIIGCVQDWRGFYCYPIVFEESPEGEWTYNLPAEYLFNTHNLPIPANPYLDEPIYPEPVYYMTALQRAAYEEAISRAAMGMEPYPEPVDYMSEEQFEQFKEAVEKYNEWYYGSLDAIKEYFRVYEEILFSSYRFNLNELVCNYDGNLLAAGGYDGTSVINEQQSIIKLDIDNKTHKIYFPEAENTYPTQILKDGTVAISQPYVYVPNTYLILPDQDEVISLSTYFSNINPSISNWMNEYIPMSTGIVYMNNDMNVFVGSLLPDDCDRYMELLEEYNTFSYVFTLDNSGIKNIEDNYSENFFRVFNLQGRKVLDTKNKEDLKLLEKGIYIINNKKVYLE